MNKATEAAARIAHLVLLTIVAEGVEEEINPRKENKTTVYCTTFSK